VIEFDLDDLDDDLRALLGLSDLLKTEAQMLREMVLDAIDPIVPLGERFKFEKREASPFYISLEVPEPSARVDLAVAWEVAQKDAKACQLVLESDPSVQGVVRVYRNTLGWLRFWSVRFPDAEVRETLTKEFEWRWFGLKALKAKARERFNLEIIRELDAV
jgi:hypothetical protein